MTEIKYRLVDGEPVCDEGCSMWSILHSDHLPDDCENCAPDSPCIPGLRQQRDALESQIITVHEDFAELREERERKIERLESQVERLESRVDEPCGDCATTRAESSESENAALKKQIEEVREARRCFPLNIAAVLREDGFPATADALDNLDRVLNKKAGER